MLGFFKSPTSESSVVFPPSKTSTCSVCREWRGLGAGGWAGARSTCQPRLPATTAPPELESATSPANSAQPNGVENAQCSITLTVTLSSIDRPALERRNKLLWPRERKQLKTPAAKAPPQFSLLNPARRGENGYRSCRRRSPSAETRWRRRGINATPAGGAALSVCC